MPSDDVTEEQRGGRLLVVSYHFPPDGAIGGLRWAGVTKYLELHGWKSVVVTVASQTKGESVPGVTIQHCWPLPTLNGLHRALRVGNVQVGGGETSDGTQTTRTDDRAAGSWLRRLRREASIALTVPDVGRGWILRATLRARSLVRTWYPDVVVSTGPPHSAHLATWLATRGTGARWFADLRDP